MVAKVFSLEQIEAAIAECQRCGDLRAYLQEVGEKKRRAYRDETYWSRPVPGFGDRVNPRIWLVGLAPGAHGANRTGRMFTGDQSGDFLYAALHRAGLAGQATATSRDDGMVLRGIYISAALRCAPPGNKPTPVQLTACRSYLLDEWLSMEGKVGGIVALGGIAWRSVLRMGRELGWALPTPLPRFGHAAAVEIGPTRLLGSYHVSQQNTFTGRLTEPMFDAILTQALSW